jgi:NAD(P)-dependent dehydrogenase (short-subunit alcohol dehydrogenase family)
MEIERVVITGTSSGLAQGIAQMFCVEGTRVAGIDIQDGAETAGMCGQLFRSFTADVADEDQVRRAFVEIDEFFGAAPNVLCNAAGIAPEVAFLDTPVEVFDRTIAVNVRGAFLCSQEAGRRMRDAGGGRIIHITSTESVQAWALQTVYGASKAALRHLTMGMAIDLAPHGITVNAVGPGACETPALAVQMQSDAIMRHDLERTPLGRWGKPADIAAAVRFLARDASWMTGQTIYVDGGYLAAGLPMLPEIANVRRGLTS